MFGMKLRPAIRPYWFVDAKWICGILFFFLMAASLFIYGLAQLTNEKNGPSLAALVIGAAFIRGDEQQNKDDARKELAEHGGVIRPIPNFPDVVITEKDLELSLTEIKLKVFRPLAESIYYDGVEGTATKFAKTPEERKKFINDAFFFRIFTRDTNSKLKNLFNTLLLICLVLLVGVIYFSAGWGRLANPGLLLLAVSLPGALLAFAVSHQPKNATGGGALGFLPLDIGQQLGDALSHSYSRASLLGVGFLIAAILGKITTSVYKKFHHKPTTHKDKEPHPEVEKSPHLPDAT